MKERPILFSGPMVRAILEGKKSQTRRVVKMRGDWKVDGIVLATVPSEQHRVGSLCCFDEAHETHYLPCPYGREGDRLWVRETHYVESAGYVGGSGRRVLYRATEPDAPCTWTPSIHMPRWASRITLEVTGVRVERLQEISEADIVAEGCTVDVVAKMTGTRWSDMPTLHHAWRTGWDFINGKRHPWESNCWVWVIEFRRLPPESQSQRSPEGLNAGQEGGR